jgi:hypothetical protein
MPAEILHKKTLHRNGGYQRLPVINFYFESLNDLDKIFFEPGCIAASIVCCACPEEERSDGTRGRTLLLL